MSKYAYWKSISQLKSVSDWSDSKTDLRGCTRFTKPNEVIGLQARSKWRSVCRAGLAAITRHSEAVRNVWFKVSDWMA